MKQILQHLGNGETILAEVPCPARAQGALLCQTTQSLVSLGTEKMLIDFGKGGWLAKARSQPDKVKQVIQKIKTDGLGSTWQTVKAKLDTPIPLGYCHVGRVLEADLRGDFKIGDRIVSNGPHAELVSVTEHLAAKIPAGVTDEAAAFAVVGAIGLQGIRLLQPTLGEKVVVSGLGLIGLMAVQILQANGCQVLGIDFDRHKLRLAESYGATTVDLSAGGDPVQAAADWTHGRGVDAVLITAATKSNELIHQAATMCRQRGRIVLVGVVGLDLQRADFYEKELSFQVSCSYGPGRYDPNYEQRGLDYPIGFVRWTEQRNFLAVLDLMAAGKLNVESLVTHRYALDDALQAYQAIHEPGALGILLNYPDSTEDSSATPRARTVVTHQNAAPVAGQVGVAFIGAGSFTTHTLLPKFPSAGVFRKTIVSSTGVSATHAAKKFGFQKSSSDIEEVLYDDEVDAVLITTRHNTHAALTVRALDAGKHVFVEKPLALTRSELEDVREAIARNSGLLMVGFNRRFSPHTIQLKSWLAALSQPKSIILTVNAGAIPADHWTQDLAVGGGRILGEACHFVDLARYLVGTKISEVKASATGGQAGQLGECSHIQLGFDDGSTAVIHYLASGCKDFPKERIEIFGGGRVLVCNNFRVSEVIGPAINKQKKFKTRSQDKGHAGELKAFFEAISQGTAWPIPANELLEVTAATWDAWEQIRGR